MLQSGFRTRFLVLMLCFFSLPLLYGQTISAIEVEGLKRMKLDVFMNTLPVVPGDVFTAQTSEQIRIAIEKAGLFSDFTINTEQEDTGGVIVRITVEEKWTLIPLPFLLYTDGALAGGMFFLETNFLGRRQVLVSGFTYIKQKMFGLLTYSNPDIGMAGLGSSFSFVIYDESDGPGSVAFAGGLSRDVLSDTTASGRLRLSLGRETSFFEGGELISSLSVPLRLQYDGTIPVSVFSRGLFTSLDVSPGWVVSQGDPALVSHAMARYALVWDDRHHLELYGYGEVEAQPFVFLNERGGGRGERTLPRNEVLTGAIFSGDISYQYLFWSSKALALTATGFFEAGAYHRDLFQTPSRMSSGLTDTDRYRLYFGPGAGLRLYVRKVAIPAMGLDVGYSIPEETVHVSFSIGVSM